MTNTINDLTRELAYEAIKTELPDLSGSEWDEKADQLAGEIRNAIDRWFSLELSESDSERQRIKRLFESDRLDPLPLVGAPLRSLSEVESERREEAA